MVKSAINTYSHKEKLRIARLRTILELLTIVCFLGEIIESGNYYLLHFSK
jgi:hypothetical protein